MDHGCSTTRPTRVASLTTRKNWPTSDGLVSAPRGIGRLPARTSTSCLTGPTWKPSRSESTVARTVSDRRARYNRALAVGDDLLQLVSVEHDPTIEELLMSDQLYPSVSIYATPGEGRNTLAQLIQSIDGMRHRETVENDARPVTRMRWPASSASPPDEAHTPTLHPLPTLKPFSPPSKPATQTSSSNSSRKAEPMKYTPATVAKALMAFVTAFGGRPPPPPRTIQSVGPAASAQAWSRSRPCSPPQQDGQPGPGRSGHQRR